MYESHHGEYSLGVHSNGRVVYDRQGNQYTPQLLANVIKAQSLYKARKPEYVTLISCNTGNSAIAGTAFAQALADALGFEVCAPHDYAWIYGHGREIFRETLI